MGEQEHKPRWLYDELDSPRPAVKRGVPVDEYHDNKIDLELVTRHWDPELADILYGKAPRRGRKEGGMGDGRERKGPGRDGGGHDDDGRGHDAGGDHWEQLRQHALRVRWRRAINEAQEFNQRHPHLAAEFNRLTDGRCQGPRGGVSVMLVRQWQTDHGLIVNGRLTRETMTVARNNGVDVQFEPGEAGAPAKGRDDDDDFGSDGEEERVISNPALLDPISDGAQRQEHVPAEGVSETLLQAGETTSRIKDGVGLAGGMTARPLVGEELEAELPWIKAALAPGIVAMILEGNYVGAAKKLARSFSPQEWMEGFAVVCKRLGYEHVLHLLPRIAPYVAGATVVWEVFLWTKDGLMDIAEQHEAGDRDARIRMYSSAFATSLLYGEAARPVVGPVTAEDREAVEHGAQDGASTAASMGEMAPEFARELLRLYGSDQGAKRAIVDELLKRAGQKPVYSAE